MKKIIFPFIIALLLAACSGEFEYQPEQQQTRSVKRGVSYNFQIPADAELLGTGVSWFYNWGPNISESVSTATQSAGMDYFPMAWNGNFNADQIRAYKAAHPECEYLLAYNEPNLTDQANMTPAQAAANWPALKSLADELNMKIISPAMNYGTLSGYSDPIVWLDEFFKLIPIDDVDGIAVHCYMGNASAMAWFLNRFGKYNKPVWLTEFCAWENNIKSTADQMVYMSDAVNYLEAHQNTVRYAWFIPRGSGSLDSYPFMQLLTKTTPYQLSALGKLYVNMSTQDKSIYYPESQRIPAEHYSSLNMAEAAAENAFANSVRVRPTTDSDGVLEIYGFLKSYWTEYQVDIRSTKKYYLEFRYAANNASAAEIYIDGEISATCNFDATGGENVWRTTLTPVPFEKGKHTIRIKVSSGNIALNWLRVVPEILL
ncbi:MAG: glycosyl hydrolase [Paludibacter sp.]|nr:glycosyl hydrolase [Paludibacter sp.]